MDITSIKEESFSFWKNLILITFFLVVTPIVLGTSLFSLISLNDLTSEKELTLDSKELAVYPRSGARVFASLPTNLPSIGGEATVSDARVELVRQYLEYWNSPLEPLSGIVVEAADKYDLDYRLITAIAQQESNLCKSIPPGSNNCWGWGIHSEGTLGFNSYQEGIDTVSRGLREEYFNKGYETVEEIMTKYTPLSNGSWAAGVTKFMSQME